MKKLIALLLAAVLLLGALPFAGAGFNDSLTISDDYVRAVNEMADTKVIGVTTRDGVCYVNLDDTFLTDPYNVTSQVAVYSIVNALTQLSTVDQVQFSINGDTNVSFMENQKFQNLYTFNSEVVASDGIESGSRSE